MRLSIPAALIIAFTAAASAEDQRTWAWRAVVPVEGPAPQPRSGGTAVFDPVARRIVIFGGQSDESLLNDIWAFDLLTSSWVEVPTLGERPEPRLGANAVYDPNGHQIVIWAGQQGSRFFNDTWALDLGRHEWRDLSPPSSARPQARYGAGAVFDLDTNSWEEVGPTPDSARPEIRCLLTAAMDLGSRRMIIHGGQRTGPLNDTWAFDLGTRQWTNLTPEVRPPGRMLASSFIDRERRFVVFGGATGAGRVNETWSFDLARGEWTRLEIAVAPPPREAAMGAFVEDEERFFVFGGLGEGRLNDLWELRATESSPRE